LVRRLKDVRDGRDKTLLFAEGFRLADEILGSPLPLVRFIATDRAEENPRGAELIRRLRERNVPETRLTDDVMGFVSDVDAPAGLIILAKKPKQADPSALRPPVLLVVLDGVQIPANVGAVIRAGEAAGVSAIFQDARGADPFGPKALRASAGSAFRVPMAATDVAVLLRRLKTEGVHGVAASPRGGTPYRDWDWTRPTALLLGAEGTGARAHDLPTVSIPMHAPVESLNIAVAAGILLQEAFHQRSETHAR
jgi:tRNA G18 (ribose-2'-O)-methylase SpoU